ncbi:amino acid adenylation domain-containing protein [Stackebrandtia soli]|uniref:amino acid adenylation domain-containing protein n=1 Tax=Stackebrandtia soli TaxID=1892856 RepID=UPI0039E8E150
MRSGIFERFERLDDEDKATFLRQLTGNPAAARHTASSFEQRRLWFTDRIGGSSALYNSPLVYRFSKALDVDALNVALAGLCERHEVLRSRFVDVDGEPVVLVSSTVPSLTVTDLRDVDEADREKALERRILDATREAFDLERDSLVRGELIMVDADDHVLALTMHHIVTDGWSVGIVHRDLSELYGAALADRAADLPPLPVQYIDYAAWQTDEFATGRMDADIEHWRGVLDGAEPVLDLPLDHARPSGASAGRGGLASVTLPPEVGDALREVGRRFEATPFMVHLALYAAMLARYSGQSDVLIGAPEAGRGRSELRDLLGLFVNTIVVRAKVGDAPSLGSLLGQVRSAALDAYQHAALPFERLVSALDVPRSLDRNPLFQAMFTCDVFDADTCELGGVPGRYMDFPSELAKFDVALFARLPQDGSVVYHLEYAADLFDPSTAEAMLADVRALAVALTEDVDTSIASVRLSIDGRSPRPTAMPVVSETPTVVAPRDDVERSVHATWAEILGHTDFGVDDAFFSVGGTSMLALKLVARLRGRFDAEVAPSLAFDHPTVAGMARRLAPPPTEVGTTAHDHVASNEPPTPPPPSELAASTSSDTRSLSLAQRRLWFLEQTGHVAATYNAPMVLRLRGPLDQAALRGAVGELARRHEVLRWRFTAVDGEPAALVSDDSVPFAWVRVDPSRPDPWAEGRRHIAAEVERPFDIAAELPTRCLVVTVAPDDHAIVLNTHHIVSDGWSQSILRRELAIAYRAWCEAAPVELPPPPRFADHVTRQRARLDGAGLDGELAYWRNALAGAPVELDLPFDRPRPERPAYVGGTVTATIPESIGRALVELGRRQQATGFMVYHAIWAAVLSQYSGQSEVLVGIPESGRGRDAVDDVVGLFVNTVVLRTNVGGDPSGEDLIARVRDTAVAAYRHAEVPFDRVVEELGVESRLNRNPLVQAFYSHDSAAEEPADLFGDIDIEENSAKFDVDLSVRETVDGHVDVGLSYVTDLFDAATAEAMLARFVGAAEAFAADPSAPLSRLARLTDTEASSLTVAVEPALARPVLTAHEYLERTADLTGDRIALRHNDTVVSFAELDAAANRLARYLRSRGVGPQTPVGIILPRDTRVFTVLFAILKAGGTYVPIDPGLPSDRLAYLLDDSAVPIVVTDSTHAPLVEGRPVEVVSLDADAASISACAGDRLAAMTDDRGAAYILYTSGSTGKPKGVVVEHHSVVSLVEYYRRTLRPQWVEVVFAASPLGFDASVFEIFAAIPLGGSLLIVDTALDLANHPEADTVTLLQTVPSLMRELLKAGPLPPKLTTVCLGGEPLPGELVQRVYDAGRVERIFNIYGPTEDTADSSWADVKQGNRRPSIGRPLPGTRGYILGEDAELVPRGARGELYLAGPGLARGYLGRDAETARRFLPDPWHPGERMYRTGDIVRLRGDGEWEYLGRADRQLKLRGLRIEPGEIEGAVTALAAVSDAAVTVRRDRHGVDRLAAYVVTTGPWDEPAVRTELRRRLPEYMVPSVFTAIGSLPLTPNGKLDESALPEPAWAAPAAPVPAATPHEHRLLALWIDVLGIDGIGVHDNFFDVGGTSFSLMTLRARIAAELGRELPVTALYDSPTVSAMARYWTDETDSNPGPADRGARLRHGRSALDRRRRSRSGRSHEENS